MLPVLLPTLTAYLMLPELYPVLQKLIYNAITYALILTVIAHLELVQILTLVILSQKQIVKELVHGTQQTKLAKMHVLHKLML